MQPVDRLYIRGMKTRVAIAAVACALTVAGCSESTSPTATTQSSTTTTRAADIVNSWQTWGRAGVDQLGQCSSEAWQCIGGKLVHLEAEAASAPPLDQPDKWTQPLKLLQFSFTDEYRKYVALSCDATPVPSDHIVQCSMYKQAITSGYPQALELFNNLANGRNVGGELNNDTVAAAQRTW